MCLTWVAHPVQSDRQLWGHRHLLSRKRPAGNQTLRCHLEETCRTCTRSWTGRQRHSEVSGLNSTLDSTLCTVCFRHELVLISVQVLQSSNLVGPSEDTDGGVDGTPSIVLGARIFGYADPSVTLVPGLTGAGDL